MRIDVLAEKIHSRRIQVVLIILRPRGIARAESTYDAMAGRLSELAQAKPEKRLCRDISVGV
jgi:hypothetical protein